MRPVRLKSISPASLSPGGDYRSPAAAEVFPRGSPDGKELFYVSGDDKLMVVTLRMGRDGIEPSAPREVFAFGQSFYTSLYDVAPNGRRILIQQREPVSENIEVIVNWPALFQKEAATP